MVRSLAVEQRARIVVQDAFRHPCRQMVVAQRSPSQVSSQRS
jgi:hypothetical protein